MTTMHDQQRCRGARLGECCRVAAAVSLLCLGTVGARAQRTPHIGYAYPAGGQQGKTFQVVVGGLYLNAISGAMVSGEGVTVTMVDYERPIQQKRVTELREALKQVRSEMGKARRQGLFQTPAEAMKLFSKLVEEQGFTLKELQQAAEYRRRKQDPKHQINPQLAETVTLEVSIAPEAAPGPRELRLGGRSGLSNPIVFDVGQLPEVNEPDSSPGFTWEFLSGEGRWKQAADRPEPVSKTLALPVLINGQILPGEVDRLRFRARQGQLVVAVVRARALMPYLADAVPGWFQATVALRDAKGTEVAYDDDFEFHPDPVLHYVIPRDGTYTLEIQDSIYRGREDFVYRIALGELPFLTGIFPLGGVAGQQAEVTLTGWNLPTNQLTVVPQADDSGSATLFVERDGIRSNPVRFTVGSLPEVMEQEPNNISASAQAVSLPVVINGRVGEAGDEDVFRFEGRAGQEVVAEVFARRLGSPLDSVLKLTDTSGVELASNDDHPDEAAGLTTHHADSQLRAVLPADGLYYLTLGDTQRQGGDAQVYRLQIAPPQPDFKLRVVPSSLSLRAGSSVPLTVHVLRAQGFTNDIELALQEAPAGFTLRNTRLTDETNVFQVTLKSATTVHVGEWDFQMEGRAGADGEEIIRAAVPADDMMQAFIYRHLVPAQEMKVAVTGRASKGK